MAKTKFFRVAVDGDTVDGRKIEASWIKDIAATFDPKTYGARVNMEHIRGISNTAPFKAYGDVVAVRTADVELNIGGKPVKKLALEAQLDVSDELIAINRDKQKIYTSIEVQPNFANSNKAYLVGLAVTDSPASLGTEVLSFALDKGKDMSLAPRLQQEGNIFSLGHETSFELDETAPTSAEAQGLFAAATAFFKQFTDGKSVEEPKKEEPKEPANDNDLNARLSALGEGVGKMAEGLTALQRDFASQIADVKRDFTNLRGEIDNTDANPGSHRPLASGTGTFAQADF